MNLNIVFRPLGHIAEEASHPSLDILEGHQSYLQAEDGTASLLTSDLRTLTAAVTAESSVCHTGPESSPVLSPLIFHLIYKRVQAGVLKHHRLGGCRQEKYVVPILEGTSPQSRHQYCNFKNIVTRKTPQDGAQVEGFFIGGKKWERRGRETGLWEQEQQKRRGRETERDKERQREKERWELGRALLKGNVVNVHRRCS